jgi:hypothetical protein
VLQKSALEISELLRAVNRLLRRGASPPRKRVTMQKKSSGVETLRLT